HVRNIRSQERDCSEISLFRGQSVFADLKARSERAYEAKQRAPGGQWATRIDDSQSAEVGIEDVAEVLSSKPPFRFIPAVQGSEVGWRLRSTRPPLSAVRSDHPCCSDQALRRSTRRESSHTKPRGDIESHRARLLRRSPRCCGCG